VDANVDAKEDVDADVDVDVDAESSWVGAVANGVYVQHERFVAHLEQVGFRSSHFKRCCLHCVQPALDFA